MSQQQTSLTIAAPGFGGLNTEVAQTEQNSSFAQIADNCVVDKFGRVGARKGFKSLTTTPAANALESIHTFKGTDGVEIVFTAGGNSIYKDVIAPTNITPAGTITDSDWQMLTLNNRVYMIQEGHDPLVYSHLSASTAGAQNTLAVNATSMPRAQCGTSAYGRIWLANCDNDNHQVVYWSQRINGENFDIFSGAGGDNGSEGGSINVALYWPTGYDEIQALASHNGRLVIFGKDNILIYAQADGWPAATQAAGGMYLEDSIRGIGCIARDSVQSTGTDVIFLDSSGLRSLGRVIQEKSAPIGEISANVRTELSVSLADSLRNQTSVKSVFMPEERLYVLMFSTGTALVFETSVTDPQTGGMRATRWVGLTARAGSYNNGSTVFADTGGVVTEYTGYLDKGGTYRMSYYTHFLSFGDSAKIKAPKKIYFTMVTGAAVAVSTFWGFDYQNSSYSTTVIIPAKGTPAEFGVSEFNIGTYGGGVSTLRKAVNVTGKGTTLQVGVELPVSNEPFSLQEITIKTLLGRTI